MGLFESASKKINQFPAPVKAAEPVPPKADDDEDSLDTGDGISDDKSIDDVAIEVLIWLDLKTGDPKDLAKRAYDIAIAMYKEKNQRNHQ